MTRTLALCLCAGLLVTPAALRADVKAGVDAWQQGDYARAVAEWLPLARAGDGDAQFNLGQAYRMGRGVAADPAAALDWFGKAAAQGHQRAQDNLGVLLFQQGRRAEAMAHLRRSAERGEPRAQYLYGTALFNGDLAPKDWVRAYAMTTRAAAAGVPQARDNLAQMDRFIPEPQRQAGLRLATQLAAGGAVGTDAEPAPIVPVAPPPSPTVGPAAPAKAPPPPATGWRVQLGAFGDAARARAHWAAISARVGALAGLKPFYATAGGITRLQSPVLAGPDEAIRLCAAVRAAGADCLPRRP